MKNILKIFKKRITVIIVPHSTSHPIKSSMSSLLILILFLVWISSFGWAVWIIGKKINYDEALRINETLKEKSDFLTKSITKSRDYIETVKEMETDLRGLLNLKSEKAIIESPGIGGPTTNDKDVVAKILSTNSDLGNEEVKMNIREMKRDSWMTTQGFRQVSNYINNERLRLLATPCMWPTFGTITSRFGWRIHPMSTNNEFHEAIDIANCEETPIRATADGKVVFSDWQGSYGRAIMIDHGHGFATRYCHISVLIAKVGEQVKRGQVIALSGSTGSSTGPHLHYEVWNNGRPVNPINYLTKK